MNLYSFISRSIVYPLYEKATGRHFLDKLEFLEESQWWDPKTLHEYQWRKLSKLLRHAYEKSAFYRRRFHECGVDPEKIEDFTDFQKIPLLSKGDIAENLASLISKDTVPNTLIRDMTSGSTGRNLTFYNDRRTLDWMTAAVLRNMKWYDVSFGDKRFKLWGSLMNESTAKKSYMAVRNVLLREYPFSSYELDSDKLDAIVAQLKLHRPKALVGYVSALEILAQYIVKQSIQDIRIPAIIPAAEMLFEHQRKLFEQVFGAEIFNRYGCHEFTAIAHECGQHDGMHINSENVYLEVLKDGRPAAPGETGEIVVTDLENFGFPFIRYRMEDMGRLKRTGCSCGRGLPSLEAVEGRVYDLIVCPNGTIQTGTFFCKMTRSVAGVEQFQVIQEAKNLLRFKLLTNEAFETDSIGFLKSKVKAHCGDDMEVAFDFVTEIKPLKSGKRRYVISLPFERDNIGAGAV